MNIERDPILDLEGFLPRRPKAINVQLDGDCGRSLPKTRGAGRKDGGVSSAGWASWY